MSDSIEWAAVDWGTSNVRAWAIAADGSHGPALVSTQGMGKLVPAQFPEVLAYLLREHLPSAGYQLSVVICGMAGARQGWCEAPYRLRALLGDRARARDELQQALPRTGAHLREIGIGHLPAWTEFDTVEQVRHWAEAKFAGHPKIRNLNTIPLNGELASVKILSRALNHAERIVVAYDRAEREPPEQAAITIADAYGESPHTNMGLDELFQVAMLGNINPLTFWSRSHNDHALPFEAARIAGRVQAGTRVTVPPHIQNVFREALTDGPSREHPDSDAGIVVALRRLVQATADLIGPDKLLRALTDSAGTGRHLIVARKTRKVSVVLDG